MPKKVKMMMKAAKLGWTGAGAGLGQKQGRAEAGQGRSRARHDRIRAGIGQK